jgi:hypothetical protein
MKRFWSPGLGRTILFSLAVVSFVIGAYQTVLQNDKNAVTDNYWLFMISFVCTMLHRFTRPKPEEAPQKPGPPQPPTTPVPRNKRRG